MQWPPALPNIYYQDDAVCIVHADCRLLLPQIAGIDAVITDPPYELGFMGKTWDKSGISFQPETWRLVLDACKPGVHLLAFGGTRTWHRIAVAIEDAGWEIRDTVMWVYGQGFPKSLDVSKAIDKMAGAEREVVGQKYNKGRAPAEIYAGQWNIETQFDPITAPATPAARQWEGWGTALKPAWEPIIVARKPLESTVAENVLKWGTGALNIDASRISCSDKAIFPADVISQTEQTYGGGSGLYADRPRPADRHRQGRFPANLIHDGSDEVLAEFAKAGTSKSHEMGGKGQYGGGIFGGGKTDGLYHADSGTAARFFYTAKASRAERDAGLEMAGGIPQRYGEMKGTPEHSPNRQFTQKNLHPTVKPLALMRYLITLITPPGGIILDPFIGSGSTMVAARQLGFRSIGIEIEEKYCEIAANRCRQMVMVLETGK